MSRILQADSGWQDALSDALASAPRPIRADERLVPRGADGRTTREIADRPALPPARQASTLLAIYPDSAGDLVMPLTVRRDSLRSHAGEVSLPGGSVEAGENPESAALREAWEEVGLGPESVRIIGSLDAVWIPVSNFELRPFVGVIETAPTLVPHDAEVASIVELPLHALWDPEVAAIEEFTVRGFPIRAGVYRFAGLRIWGATAITLGMLARVLDP